MADEQPIIIKKKGGHGGGHGGAWKVAYADFVTAMMALFIVLWLMSSSKPVQEAVGGYFRDPNGTGSKKGSALGSAGMTKSLEKKEDLAKLKESLMKAMEQVPNFDKLKKQVEMTVTPEGLKIELIEDPNGTFFENGKAQPTAIMQKLLLALSVPVGKLPNPVSIEGHTDSKPFSNSKSYGNWELSTDRANAARRLMETSGLRPNQVIQVRGYADQNLRKPLQPEDASNRRVTVLIQKIDSEAPPLFLSNGDLPIIKPAAAPAAAAPAAPETPAKDVKPEKKP